MFKTGEELIDDLFLKYTIAADKDLYSVHGWKNTVEVKSPELYHEVAAHLGLNHLYIRSKNQLGFRAGGESIDGYWSFILLKEHVPYFEERYLNLYTITEDILETIVNVD